MPKSVLSGLHHMLQDPQDYFFSANIQIILFEFFSVFILSLINYIDITNLLRSGPMTKISSVPHLTVSSTFYKYLLTFWSIIYYCITFTIL